jgi:hypothetical protein
MLGLYDYKFFFGTGQPNVIDANLVEHSVLL